MNQYYNPQAYPSKNQPVGQDNKTLWIGDVAGLDENYVRGMFSFLEDLVNVKLIREKGTNRTLGYGFIEFASHYSAQRALALNGTPVGTSGRFYRLNWAKTAPNSASSNPSSMPPMQMVQQVPQQVHQQVPMR